MPQNADSYEGYGSDGGNGEQRVHYGFLENVPWVSGGRHDTGIRWSGETRGEIRGDRSSNSGLFRLWWHAELYGTVSNVGSYGEAEPVHRPRVE